MADNNNFSVDLCGSGLPESVGRKKMLFFSMFFVGACGSAFGFFAERSQFAHSWLFALFVFFSFAAGSLFWTILHHATDSEWSVLVRRQAENIAGTLPFLALAFLPLVACAPILWKWWSMLPGVDPLLDAKSAFLNRGFFLSRATIYFVCLGGLAVFLRRESILQDADGSVRRTLRMRRFAVVGLPLLAVCLTFAGVDWLMGLDYHWFSTMWGVYLFAGAAGSSMALIVLVVSALRRSGGLQLISSEHFHVMGKFMFAFTVFWAYVGYSQYMLIWYANIPEETIYFRIRNTEGWQTLSTFLVAGRFFALFPILLFQGAKRSPWIICCAAVWMLIVQLVDIYLVVLPSFHPTGPQLSVYDFSSLLCLLGYCGFFACRNIGSSNLFACRDPRLSGSVNLRN
jgi:hypothetical protein